MSIVQLVDAPKMLPRVDISEGDRDAANRDQPPCKKNVRY